MTDDSTAQPHEPGRALVLIADDEPSIAQTVALIVEDAGGTPLIAHDGREALELARSALIRLVITDLTMPRMGGAALVQALRQDADAQGERMPPVILMTATHLQNAHGMRIDAFLPKPFDLAELQALLQRYLGC